MESSTNALEAAVALYENSTRIDAQLQDEQWRRLWKSIQEAIAHRERHLDYTVPAQLFGAYQLYDRHEMLLHLLRECRREKLTAALLDPAGYTFRVSGWAESARSKKQQHDEFTGSIRIVVDPDASEAHRAGALMPPNVSRAAAFASATGAGAAKPPAAKLGALSSRLRQINNAKQARPQ